MPSVDPVASGRAPGSGEGARLVLLGGSAPAEFLLRGSDVLGRSMRATVRLTDPEVSRKHSRIDRDGHDHLLSDLGSSNGTFVNGRCIAGATRLKDGDEVTIGTSRLLFRAGSGGDEAAAIVEAQSAGALEGVIALAEVNDDFAPLDQVRDVEQVKRDYERLRIGHEFNRHVRLERNLGDQLARILGFAFDLIPADNGVILLRDPASKELVIQATRQRKPAQRKVLVSDTLLKKVQVTQQAVLTSDANAEETFAWGPSSTGLGVRSAMAVPLLAGDELKGIFFLESRERAAAFTTNDLEVLSAIAAQASIALENSEYASALEREAVQRAQLSRSFSPALVEQAARGALQLTKGSQLSEVTILFSDIRGFTSISEKQPAQEVVKIVNDYFEMMVDVLFEHGGTLDRLVGDALVGMWGAPVRRTDDATRAVRAAVQMQEKLKELNAERLADGKQPLRIGIGLHTGAVVVGDMGSSKALSYTAIGDGVNVAWRLCEVAREDMIVVSEECAAKAGKENFLLDRLPATKMNDREVPVEIWSVKGLR